MPLDRTTPDLAFLRAIVPAGHWPTLEDAVEVALRSGDAAARQHLERAQLPDGDLQLLTLAYSLWRGVGPALDVESVWGLDPGAAARLLAGLALAIDRSEAAGLLAAARALLVEEAGQSSQDG